jgi:hypothetical protein
VALQPLLCRSGRDSSDCASDRSLKTCAAQVLVLQHMLRGVSVQEYLGVVPPDDAKGCLQDVHWSAGLFG